MSGGGGGCSRLGMMLLEAEEVKKGSVSCDMACTYTDYSTS